MRKGFTLVEIIAVVVILLVITLFTTPVLKKLINNGNDKERAIIEERVLVAAKEYASSYDNSFYDKLVRTGDYNYIYKTDLVNSGLIDEEDISTLDNLIGVRGELLLNDNIKYTLSYIDNPVNGYCEEEVYTMIQQLQNEVAILKNGGGSGSSGSGTTGNVLDTYPVGSIYLSISDTNPSNVFGGTWVSFGSGKTLIGVDSNNSKFNTVEKTGGSEAVNYTPVGTVGAHALTVAELPSHTHSIPSLSGTTSSAGAHTHTSYQLSYPDKIGAAGADMYLVSPGTQYYTSSAGAHTHSVTTNASTTGSSGSSSAHSHTFTGTSSNINVLDPYITVYMWKRTA